MNLNGTIVFIGRAENTALATFYGMIKLYWWERATSLISGIPIDPEALQTD